MVCPHAACCLKCLDPLGGIPTMNKLVNGLPDDLTFSLPQNLTEPRNGSVFLLCNIYLSSHHTLYCIESGVCFNGKKCDERVGHGKGKEDLKCET